MDSVFRMGQGRQEGKYILTLIMFIVKHGDLCLFVAISRHKWRLDVYSFSSMLLVSNDDKNLLSRFIRQI